MKLIDAKELWRNRPEYRNPIQEEHEEFNKGWNACIDEFFRAINEQPTINQWIPVSEKLPQDNKVVLICHEHIRSIDFVRNGEWQTYDNVDAWMPLPERYEGDGMND